MRDRHSCGDYKRIRAGEINFARASRASCAQAAGIAESGKAPVMVSVSLELYHQVI